MVDLVLDQAWMAKHIAALEAEVGTLRVDNARLRGSLDKSEWRGSAHLELAKAAEANLEAEIEVDNRNAQIAIDTISDLSNRIEAAEGVIAQMEIDTGNATAIWNESVKIKDECYLLRGLIRGALPYVKEFNSQSDTSNSRRWMERARAAVDPELSIVLKAALAAKGE